MVLFWDVMDLLRSVALLKEACLLRGGPLGYSLTSLLDAFTLLPIDQEVSNQPHALHMLPTATPQLWSFPIMMN